jgi:hypothetical protein
MKVRIFRAPQIVKKIPKANMLWEVQRFREGCLSSEAQAALFTAM